MGEITWDIKDIKYRKALWKEEDRKLAYVFFVCFFRYYIF